MYPKQVPCAGRLDLYTRRTEGHDRILRALIDPDDGPDDDGPTGALIPAG